MTISTYVCADCHAGWTVQENEPVASRHCRWCGQVGTLRGQYVAVRLP